ncbi:MAG TPA: DoxX family protein [Terriglobales bacterium]|nr:DoxX family protein [Terriglobales bacterium]
MEAVAYARSKSSTKAVWTGRILGGLAVLFLFVDAIMKLIRPLPTPVSEAAVKLGYPPQMMPVIGGVLLACVIVHVIPRTSMLGAILLTGYLGGAVATHTRVGDPLFSHVLFPVYVGVLVWGGLFLRDECLRELLPFRR